MSLHDLSGHDEKLLKDNTDNADFPFNTRDTVYSCCSGFSRDYFHFWKKKSYYVKSFLSCRKKNVFYIFKIKRGCRLLLAINNNKNASEYNATVIHEARYNWLNTSGCIYFAFCYPLVITGITQPKSVCGSF